MIGTRILGYAFALTVALGVSTPRSADAFCIFLCDYTKTKYPLVLAHGFAGFDQFLGIEYWYGIPSALRDGGAKVYVTDVSPFHTPAARGEQLIDQIEQIVAITGKPKVNLIGHSQGGLDVRYAASVRPGLVASVTTVGTPHKGEPIADLIVSLWAAGGLGELLRVFGEGIVDLLELITGADQPEEWSAAIASLSTPALAQFAAQHPQGMPATSCGEGAPVVNGIRYYSWGGTAAVTNVLDFFDAIFGVAAALSPGADDGLVPRCSTHLGDVIRDNYFHNHLDQVNHVFGITGIEQDPRSIYRAHANRLKNAGL